jgi:class 3 adenylate cyclase
VLPAATLHEERKVVTVVFSDVVGFTGLGESLDPEALRSVMGRYFDAMRTQVERRGGRVEKFIGDAVVAVFGVPSSHEDDVDRALGCALAMRRELDRLNASFTAERGIRLQLRIGVTTGEVLAASAARPEEGLVTGDAVTIAARLQEAADTGQVLVTARTAVASRSFAFRSLGERQLKGRSAPISVLELVGEAARPPGPERTTPLIDRNEPLAALEARYARALEQQAPGLVTVYGEPGVGKSRLAAEFVARVTKGEPRPQVLSGRCRPPGESGAYGALGEILKARAGILDSDPPASALDRIDAFVDLLLPAASEDERVRNGAALAHSIGLEDPRQSLAALPPRQTRYEIHRAWRAWFEGLLAERPVVAIIEDLHWADSALLDLLEDVIEHVGGPLFMLGLARPELAAAAPGWSRGPGDPLEIVLEPLVETDAVGLVAGLVPERWLPDAVVDRIVARAEGNPLFLEEIVRGLVDRGAIGRGEAGSTAAELVALPIPDTVQAMLAARIDLLDPRDKRSLQAASVAGTSLWPGLLARLVDGDAAAMPGILERLEARALIVPRAESSIEGEREYAFKHALTQQVAYESLPRRERMRAHARTAGWLEQTLGEGSRASAETLAHHYETAYRAAADDPGVEAATREDLRARALAALLQAAANSLSTLALDGAERLATRALDLARGDFERSQALEALGEQALAGYRGDRAWKALLAAADARVAAAPEDHAAVSRLCARALELPTRWGSLQVIPSIAEARYYLDLGLEHAGTGDSEARARLLTSSAVMPLAFFDPGASAGEFEAAQARGEEAVEIARHLDRPDLESAALDGLGSHAYSRGEYQALDAINRQRLALVPRLDDIREIEDVHAMAAWGAFNQGRYADALSHADEGFRRAVEVSPAVAVHCLEWRSLAHFELGQWDEFLTDVARATTLLPGREDEGRPGFRRRPWMVAALMHRLRGDSRGSEDALGRMLPTAIPGDDQAAEEPDPGRPWQALLLARQGRFDEARAATLVPDVPWFRQAAGLLLASRCDVVAMAGHWDDVPALLGEVEAEARRGGLLALRAHALRLEGRAARARSDLHSAVDALSKARVEFHRLGARWERACTELDLAESLAAVKRPDQARACFAGAWSVLEELHSVDELARASELRARLSEGSGSGRV